MAILGDAQEENICYSINCGYWIDRMYSQIYVRLYRLKDKEAWAVRQAYSCHPTQIGDWMLYRDDGFRDYDAIIITKVEYETFKIFDKIGKE